eukprot:4131665-Prymnesium_polylepis.1
MVGASGTGARANAAAAAGGAAGWEAGDAVERARGHALERGLSEPAGDRRRNVAGQVQWVWQGCARGSSILSIMETIRGQTTK